MILPDARGHGASDAPERGYLYKDLAADVRGLIGSLRLHAPVLLGHSMGGMTAALIASERSSHFSAVILIDPTFISPEWQRDIYESGVATEHQQLLAGNKDELLAQARLKSPNRSAEMIGYLVDARLETSLNAFDVLTPPNPDWRELVRALTVPSLLVTGDRGIVSLETALELQNLNRLLRHDHLADAGHGMPYDDPERLGETVLAFLAQTTAAKSGLAPAL